MELEGIKTTENKPAGENKKFKLRKNSLIIICGLTSAIGLVLIYFAASSIQAKILPLREINTEFVGRLVTTSGYITYKRTHPSGHLFLTIADDTERNVKMEVPLFAGFLDSLKDINIEPSDFKTGRTIVVTGTVDEYRESLQIVPRKPSDIKFVLD